MIRSVVQNVLRKTFMKADEVLQAVVTYTVLIGSRHLYEHLPNIRNRQDNRQEKPTNQPAKQTNKQKQTTKKHKADNVRSKSSCV